MRATSSARSDDAAVRRTLSFPTIRNSTQRRASYFSHNPVTYVKTGNDSAYLSLRKTHRSPNLTDFLSSSERSVRMSLIRSRDTKPEVALRSRLHRLGLRFRLGVATLPGRPDIVLRRHRTVVFVHGCFWHRHNGCRVASNPKSNTDFWAAKFKRNVERDNRVIDKLEALGWRVIVVWECELSSRDRLTATAERVAHEIRN